MSTYRLAFTSCMDASDRPSQPIWKEIADAKPDILLLLGDQIYMDWGIDLGLPNAKRKFLRDAQAGAADFAAEMYERYADQWAVREFREAMQQIRAGGGQVLLTWDDHDFAWNNACGDEWPGGSADDNESVVPQTLKDISIALFRQFEDVVTKGSAAAAYPPMPALQGAGQDLGVRAVSLGPWPVVVLDERSHRQPFASGGASLLGNAAWDELGQHIRSGSGLLIVAGSSPLKHDYGFGEQGWWVPPQRKTPDAPPRSYADYRRLLDEAADRARPLLYLAGDIHRNAYGGAVETDVDDAPTTSVVQVLSSGAARSRPIVGDFPPSWALLEIEATDPDNCTIQLAFHANGALTAEPRRLEVRNGRWTAELPVGECARVLSRTDRLSRLVSAMPGAGSLTMLCSRRPNRDAPASGSVDLSGLDALYLDDVDRNEAAIGRDGLRLRPEPVVMMIDAPRATLVRGAADDDAIYAKLAKAFAVADPAKGVALFIHGFNKSFSDAALEANLLRRRFGIEPILYSWPSGDASGPFATYGAWVKANRLIDALTNELGAALLLFANQAKVCPQVPAIIVARSLGVEALKTAIDVGVAGNWTDLKSVRRVILSAPTCLAHRHHRWLEKLPTPAIVTVNTADDVLAHGDLIGGADRRAPAPHQIRLLGRTPLAGIEPAANAIYLDMTAVTGVDVAHDYWLPRLGSEVVRVNDHLMGAGPVTATSLRDLRVPGLKVLS